MKVTTFTLRGGLSLVLALSISYAAAVYAFDVWGYQSSLDRALLIAIPALALATLIFGAWPASSSWLRRRQGGVLLAFGVPVLIGALASSLTFTTSANLQRGAASAIALYALMLPAAPAVERARVSRSLLHYSLGFLAAVILTYGAVAVLEDVLKTARNMVAVAFVLCAGGSVLCYYAVRRVAWSLHDGFLARPLNVALCLAPGLLLAGLITATVRMPDLDVREYFSMSPAWFGSFAAGVLVGGVWGIVGLDVFEGRLLYERLQRTRLFAAIEDNLPGLYAAGMFSLINLTLALAFNHPALSLNSVLFESDAGPWSSILGSPQGDSINRSVHPLALITLRPLVRLVAAFLGDEWHLAPMLTVAVMSGLCVLMAWLFVLRATHADTYAFIFAVVLGSTATHLLFGSLTETFAFAMASLMFFFLLIQVQERRFLVLVPAGALVLGVTISNIAQPIIGLFFSGFGFRRLVRLVSFIFAVCVALTVLVGALFPSRQTLFFVPSDLAFEGNFIRAAYATPLGELRQRLQLVSRTMFLYGVVGPGPVEIIAHKDPHPTIDLKTVDARTATFASYRGAANIPLAAWLVLLAGAFLFFAKGLRLSPHAGLMLGLLGSLLFNILLHMNYGTELYLYTPYWTYALVFFVALAYAQLAGNQWFEYALATFMLMLMINNAQFMLMLLRALAPFFAAA